MLKCVCVHCTNENDRTGHSDRAHNWRSRSPSRVYQKRTKTPLLECSLASTRFLLFSLALERRTTVRFGLAQGSASPLFRRALCSMAQWCAIEWSTIVYARSALDIWTYMKHSKLKTNLAMLRDPNTFAATFRLPSAVRWSEAPIFAAISAANSQVPHKSIEWISSISRYHSKWACEF